MKTVRRLPDGSNIPLEGQIRRLQLYQAVATDLRVGDRTLECSLKGWRDDVFGRLPKPGGIQIKIPWIFVATLGLKTQTVWMDPDGSVRTIQPHFTDGTDSVRGPLFHEGVLLVPAVRPE